MRFALSPAKRVADQGAWSVIDPLSPVTPILFAEVPFYEGPGILGDEKILRRSSDYLDSQRDNFYPDDSCSSSAVTNAFFSVYNPGILGMTTNDLYAIASFGLGPVLFSKYMQYSKASSLMLERGFDNIVAGKVRGFTPEFMADISATDGSISAIASYLFEGMRKDPKMWKRYGGDFASLAHDAMFENRMSASYIALVLLLNCYHRARYLSLDINQLLIKLRQKYAVVHAVCSTSASHFVAVVGLEFKRNKISRILVKDSWGDPSSWYITGGVVRYRSMIPSTAWVDFDTYYHAFSHDRNGRHEATRSCLCIGYV